MNCYRVKSLVKCSSNRDAFAVLSKIDKEKLCLFVRDINLSVEHFEKLPLAKTLGCFWDTDTESFQIVASLEPLEKCTWGTMLGQLSKSFDPLGIFSCFFLKIPLDFAVVVNCS